MTGCAKDTVNEPGAPEEVRLGACLQAIAPMQEGNKQAVTEKELPAATFV